MSTKEYNFRLNYIKNSDVYKNWCEENEDRINDMIDIIYNNIDIENNIKLKEKITLLLFMKNFNNK